MATPQPAVPEGYDDYRPDDFTVRITRADTWLGRAREIRQAGDLDLTFVLYWTSFNAAYARDPAGGNAEREFAAFFRRLRRHDPGGSIHDTLRASSPDPIENLLGNKYLFRPFWDFLNRKPKGTFWEGRFLRANRRALTALRNDETELVLKTVFDRIYTLRNQLVHGGARWESRRNRDSVSDGVRIMESLVPVFLGIMRANRDAAWGQPYYRPGLELPRRNR